MNIMNFNDYKEKKTLCDDLEIKNTEEEIINNFVFDKLCLLVQSQNVPTYSLLQHADFYLDFRTNEAVFVFDNEAFVDLLSRKISFIQSCIDVFFDYKVKLVLKYEGKTSD